MNKIKLTLISLILLLLVPLIVFAQPTTYIVKSGDSLWKIAVKYEIGISEIIASNPSIKNPSMIYPGQKVIVPNIEDIKIQENEVIRLVNIERKNNGLTGLKGNWQVSRIARYKSKDMADLNYFAHYSKTYGSPFDMLETFGVKFSAAGENIASGQKTPKEVVTAWMNSPGHRSNILSPSYTEIGVGLAKNKEGKCYWTQMFIKPY